MTTLITGAGLVGSAAAAALVASGEEPPVLYDLAFSEDNLRRCLPLDKVDLVRGDITDISALLSVLRDYKVDRIFHTAALLARAVREHPFSGVRVNILGTACVLEAARLGGATRVVLCSSNALMLGMRVKSKPVSEDFRLRVVTERPPSTYSAAKLYCEWLGQSYQAHYGLECAALRLSGVFGPWRGTVPGGPGEVIKRVIEGARAAQPVVLEGIVRPWDYLYAPDAGLAAMKALTVERLPRGVYNIAMGRNYSLAEVLEVVQQSTGIEIAIELRDPVHSGASDTEAPPVADVRAAAQDLGWRPQYTLEKAIPDYLARC